MFQGASKTVKFGLIGASAFLIVVGFVFYGKATGGCPILRGTVSIAGTNGRLAEIARLGSCVGPFNNWLMFCSDIAIIIGYWLLTTIVIANGWWRYEAIALRRLLSTVMWIPALVAVCDVIEDFLLLLFLNSTVSPPQFHPPSLATATFVFSWTKWALLVLTLVIAVMSLSIWISRRHEKYSEDHPNFHIAPEELEDRQLQALGSTAPEPNDDAEIQRLGVEPRMPESPSERIGVCFSGGGIRSAAFSLGVLKMIEGRGGPESIVGQARYISAVSGGSWAATAWTLERSQIDKPAAVADTIFERLTTPGGYKGFQPQKFLINGRLSINGLIGWAVLCSFVNIALIALLVFLIAWPLGFLMGTSAIRPDLPAATQIAPLPDSDTLAAIAIVISLVGVAGIVACGFFGKRVASKWVVGTAVIALGALTAAYLIGLPALFVLIANEPSDTLAQPATTAAVVAVGTSVGASIWTVLWRVISGPLTKEVTGIFTRLLPRLFGLFIVLGWLAWACVVMYYAARRKGLHGLRIGDLQLDAGSWAALLWLVAAVLLAMMYAFLNPNWPTLNNIYARRLATTFDPASLPQRLPGDVPRTAMTWDTLAERSRPTITSGVPELILCCAQQRVGIARGGLRAESFTISPHWVRQGKRSLQRFQYAEALRAIARTRPHFSNTFRDLHCVAPWLATTGAAFSSAMGRQSLGSANAVLATVNADLGVWLPNVAEVQEFWREPRDDEPGRARGERWRERLPKPRFAYIFKEILGWYSLRDRYVFITDGGHWENLGLVELLRRKCDVIYCVDASGDPPGTFATLREAMTLESLELHSVASQPDLDSALADMLPRENGLPKAIATSFALKRSGQPDAVVHYTKLQATEAMPDDLRRFAVADPAFPHYSTAKQFLTAKQFKNLYLLGQFAGQNLVATARTFAAAPSPGQAFETTSTIYPNRAENPRAQ